MKSITKMNIVFFICASIVLGLDQYTKYMIQSNIPASSSLEIIPNFLYITHVKNPGAAFGLFQDATPVLTIISFVAIIMIIVIKYFLKIKSYFYYVSLGLILGGALGNLIDRFFLGEVIDFIHVAYWPVFNIADSSIVVGFIIVIILLFKEFFKKSEEIRH